MTPDAAWNNRNNETTRERLLVRLFGSHDPIQFDEIGGTMSGDRLLLSLPY